MAYVAADWTIDRQTGDIRYIGDDHSEASPSYATVIEFHRALQALADNASSTGADDELDITDNTPSDRSTDNIVTLNAPYNIGGSDTTSSGAATMTDTGATFGTSDELVGYTIYNTVTGAQGIITSHTNTVITADMY